MSETLSETLVSTGLSGGLLLCLVGLLLSAARRPGAARALVGVGLILWAAGLWAAVPIIRIVALGMFVMFAFVALAGALAVWAATAQPKRNGLAAAPILLFPVFTAPWAAFAGPVFNRLFAAQQSPSLASASQWLSIASVALLAVALAIVLTRPARRAEAQMA